MNIGFKMANIADYEYINNYLCKLNDEHYENMPEVFEKSNGIFYKFKKYRKKRFDNSFILITLNNENVGMVQLEYSNSESIVYLYAIYIDEKYRGCGIGKAALEYAENMLRNNGWDILRLTVWDYNRAIHLYERCGYVLWKEKGEYCTQMYKRLRD